MGRDAAEVPPQVGGAQVTLIAIVRSLSGKTKENSHLQLLMQLSTFQLFLEILFIFFKFADECSRSILNDLPPDVTSKMIKSSEDKAGFDK